MEKRKLTTAERAVYGKCSVCGAAAGKPCKPNDATGSMARMMDGAHLGRLHVAPTEVEDAPVAKPKAAPKAKATRKPAAKAKKSAA